MSEENENYSSKMSDVDIVSILQQRLANRKAETSSNSSHSKAPVDPYQIMVNRRKQNAGEVAAEYPVQNWPQEDISKLEEFCFRHNIVGFNCGAMSPLAALAFLKNKLGIIDNPPTSEGYGPNYPYMETVKKKILLRG